jgi:hypothetical protein
MNTIKIVQKYDREYIPDKRTKSSEEPSDFVEQVTIIDASHICHRPYTIIQKDLYKWLEEQIGGGDAMYVGNPFNEGGVNSKIAPDDYRHNIHFLTHRDAKDDFKRIILSSCIVYIMNDKGQTVDSFGC